MSKAEETLFIVRPVCLKDLEGVLALAHSSGPGMTTLPKDKKPTQKKKLSLP